MTVDSSQPDGAITTAWLAGGTTYDFTVSGSFQFGDATSFADAKCSTTDGFTWSASRYGASELHLLIDGVVVPWSPNTDVIGCDTVDHVYRLSYIPSDDHEVLLAVAAGPGSQSEYIGSLEVDITGPGVATPPSRTTSPAASKPSEDPAPPPQSPPQSTSPDPSPSQNDLGDTSQNDVAPSPPPTTPDAPASDGASAAPIRTDPVVVQPQAPPLQANATPHPSPGGGSGVTGDPFTNFMLSDQPKAAPGVDSRVVLETARPRGSGLPAPSPLILIPLAAALLVLLRPRQTLAFTLDVARKVPSPRRSSAWRHAPWRVSVESTPPEPAPPASVMERPVLSLPAQDRISRRVRIRRRMR